MYALSTAPSLLPTALSLYGFEAVRPAVRSNLSLKFDMAFDVDAAGRVRLLQPKLLVAPQSAALVTGFQVVSNTTFEGLTRAPTGGYQYDSAMVVTPRAGRRDPDAGLGPGERRLCDLDADVREARRRQCAGGERDVRRVLRGRVDTNCGFRSLEEGLPKS